ncbi:uncharacterized protein DUF2442 [Spirosoma oryzae]|uniref:Uncharacterized protein DUF2442 n=1 Tax=Spirosoma oryzae TaxID=1469603 RepID=A0A2T0SKN8_9BACT|nr:DUF2442 domain-containing protein [Spirosoma oryzae]PRY33966.1 uncharacterized protein DUF2442 [Spirosoma oryzae]
MYYPNPRSTDQFTTQRVWFDAEHIYVELNDGRIIGSPLAWFPRLQKATPAQRNRFDLVAGGYGIHWEELDEDLTAGGFLTYSRP